MDLIADKPATPLPPWRGPGIPKPHTPLPWRMNMEDLATVDAGDYVLENEDREEVGGITYGGDMRYALTACNGLPALIDLLERIEATTKDPVTADTIRQYLKNTNIWT